MSRSSGNVLELFCPRYEIPTGSYDISSNKHTLTETAITWESLPSGLSVPRFNDTTSVIVSTERSKLESMRSSFTWKVWARPESCDASRRVAEITPHLLWIPSTTRFTITAEFAAVAKYAYSPIGSLVLNKWHLIFAMYNGANMLIEVDGTLVTGDAAAGLADVFSQDFHIGNRPLNDRAFDGLMNIEMWSRVLSAGERNNIFKEERTLFGV